MPVNHPSIPSSRSGISFSAGRFQQAFILSAFLIGLCLTGAGCSQPPAESPYSTCPSGDCITYTDGIGQKVEIPRHPQRIISLAPNVTETLYLLGAQDRLIGNTIQCTWPEASRHKPKIGDLLNPNYEKILAAKPDLVIASTAGNDRAAVMKLVKLGIPVYVIAPRSVEMILQCVEDMGRITDCADKGLQLAAQMRERLDKVTQHIAGMSPVRAFFITWFETGMV